MKISHLPKPVRTVAVIFFGLAVVFAMLALISTSIEVLIILGGDRSSAYPPGRPTGFGLFSLWCLGLASLCGIEYWWLRNRKRWAYYLLRPLVLQNAITQVLFGTRQEDWLTSLINSPETKGWFFEQDESQ